MSSSLALVRILGNDQLDINTRDTNIGLGYLAAYASEVCKKVNIYDPISIHGNRIEKYSILLSKYDVVGFTLHCLNINQTLKLIRKIKKINSDVLIAVGGHHASGSAESLLNM